MAAKLPKLSIVCPAYEEELGLFVFHRELSAALEGLRQQYEFEILYVDDGSRDHTLDLLRELADRDLRVRYLSLSRNFGQQAALTAGIDHATGDAVISMDADLQHPPALIPELVRKWRDGYDVVLTIRAEDKRLSWAKRLSSKLFYRVMNWMSTVDIRPARSDYRLLSRKAVTELRRLREHHRFLRGLVQWLALPTAEIPFVPDARRAGRTKYNWIRMLGLAGDGILSFSRTPVRLIMLLGLLLMGVSALSLTVLLTRGLLDPRSAAPAWSWVLLSIYVIGGVLLFAVGVVGEYVGRVYEQVKERPLYIVKEDSFEAQAAHTSRLSQHEAPRKHAA